MAKPTRRFVPCLEAFDDRCLPSVTFAEVSNGNGTFTLNIVGDSQADTVAIADDGTGLAGAITVNADGQTTYFSQNPISEIHISTGGGNDVVDYTLTADMVFSRSIIANLGAKNDIFSAHLGSWNIGGQADANGVFIGVSLNFQVSGDAGNDTFNVTSANHVRWNSSFTVSLVGGKGKDVFNTDYSGVSVDPQDPMNPDNHAGFFFPSQTQ